MSVVPDSNTPRTQQNVSVEPDHTDGSNQGQSAEASVSWQRQLSEAMRSPAELLTALGIPRHSDKSSDSDAADHQNAFPTLVPLSFLQRMEPGNSRDPLLLQVLSTAAEDIAAAGFVADPVGDAAAREVPGLLQKYHGRALLMAAGACAVHCRYCFRREYPYHDEPRTPEDWIPALNQIASDSSLSEVILSGGDPLMLNDERLKLLLQQLDRIAHVQRIRIHTRLPIVLPARVTERLLTTLTSLRAQPVVVVHANHGNEIVADCREALRLMVKSGIPVLNQAVLLRDINDNVEALDTLCRRLINIGVMPYYLHQLDRVQGAAHFETDRRRGVDLVRQLSARLPGYAVPKFVEEVPGEPNKTAINF